jgi:hypothetical protein
VYYIPRLTTRIISVGRLDEEGYEVLIKGVVMSLRDPSQKLLARLNRNLVKLYKLEFKIAQPVCLAAFAGSDAWLWHTRFGQVNFGSLRKMSSEGHVQGLPVIDCNTLIFIKE